MRAANCCRGPEDHQKSVRVHRRKPPESQTQQLVVCDHEEAEIGIVDEAIAVEVGRAIRSGRACCGSTAAGRASF
ncbi:MAG: hypothetical protein U0570_04275 [Phycisphaerales bacterium]